MNIILLVCFCAGIAIVDLKTFRIPDGMLLAFVLTATMIGGWRHYLFQSDRLTASAVALLIFGTVWYCSQGIGLGDVKYAAVLGYVLGFERLFPAFFITAVLGTGVYLAGMLLFHWPKTVRIPFAPFLSAGAIATVSSGFL